MSSNPRRLVVCTSLLLLCFLASACGQAVPGDTGQDRQPISGAHSLVSHSSGRVLVNGRPYTLDAELRATDGTFSGTIREDLTAKPIRPPEGWQFPDIMLKAHTRGTFFDFVARTAGDTAVVDIEVGQVGWLRETTVVVSQNPLRYEHTFEGQLALPEGDVPLLPWDKADMDFVYEDGSVIGSAELRATVLRNGERVPVTYPVRYSGTFSARRQVRVPIEVTADVRFQQYDPATGAFAGTESPRGFLARP